MFSFWRNILILSAGLLIAASAVAEEAETIRAKQPIDPSNLASYQGHSLHKLTDRMPAGMVEPLLLRFRIKAVANGITAFKTMKNENMLQYDLDVIMHVGTDVGEEDLIHASDNPKFKAFLESEACVLELFPTNFNFNQSVETWDNYIFCLKPAIVIEDGKVAPAKPNATPQPKKAPQLLQEALSVTVG